MVDNSCTVMWSVMVDVQKIAEFSHLRVLASCIDQFPVIHPLRPLTPHNLFLYSLRL